MLDNDQYLHGLFHSTRRLFSLLTHCARTLILGHFVDLIKNPSSRLCDYNKLVGKQHCCSGMEVQPIEISSSDSDFDSDDDFTHIASSPDTSSVLTSATRSARVLPPNWTSAPSTSSATGLQPQIPNLGPSNGGFVSRTRGTSSFGGIPGSAPSTSYATNVGSSRENGSGSGSGSASIRHDAHWDSNAVHGNEPQQKRSFPSSFGSAGGARQKQNSYWDNGGSYHSAGPSGSKGFASANETGVHILDRHGHQNSRILPPSMMRGKPASSMPFGGSNDPLQNMGGFGEERVIGDERIIFQAALQDINQPTREVDVPTGVLSVPLLRHQKIALAWMVQKELRSMHCMGGILADDQGLGKTISTIALIQKQRKLQMKSQSEKNQNHNAEPMNVEDDDDKGSASVQAANKTDNPSSTNCKPETYILDDDDDVSASSETVKKMEDLAGSKKSSDVSSSDQKLQRQRPAAGTLIVCPASVLRQWARELDDKVAQDSKLSVLVYHGGNRTKDPTEVAKYDVVLTTYAIVSNEVPKQPVVDEDDVDQKLHDKYGISSEFSVNKKRKQRSESSKKGKKARNLAESLFSQSGALARVNWLRVVLDEAQTIKNHRTQTARACCGLRAKRRWCLSGTPIQNSIDEFYSYFRFLRHHLYSNYKAFCEGIKFPISRDPTVGYKKLQAVLKTLLLRRTKETLLDGEPIISLPPKHITMKKVNFSPEERSFYANLEAESRAQFKEYAAAGTVNQNYANILLMILRLRQACDHPLLVKGFNSDSVRITKLDKARELPRNLAMELLKQLEVPTAICRICSDPVEEAVVTACRHIFCCQCVLDYLTGDDNMCPVRKCKEQVSRDALFSAANLRSCLFSDADGNVLNYDGSVKSSSILSSEYSSSKVKAALEVLQSHIKSNTSFIELEGMDENDPENPMQAQVRTQKTEGSLALAPIKTIVFSQWTRMLDLLEYSLNQYGFQYRRLDGGMSLAARDRAVREFNSDNEVTVMLMSLKAGNLGLNMVAASHVILLDLWWNPSTEDQAIDRAHRIGQTRAVTVSRITVKDTVEDRILALQEEKRKMVASAFGEDRVGTSATRLTADDLKYLFLGSRG